MFSGKSPNGDVGNYLRKRLWWLLIPLGAITISLAGCATDNFKDVKGVPNRTPDILVNYENMDGHPNIGMMCIKGAGIMTTTRSYSAATRVPEWDAYCKSVEK